MLVYPTDYDLVQDDLQSSTCLGFIVVSCTACIAPTSSPRLAQDGLYVMLRLIVIASVEVGCLSRSYWLILASQGVNEECFDWEMVVSRCVMSVCIRHRGEQS